MRTMFLTGVCLLFLTISPGAAEEFTLVKRATKPEVTATASYTVKTGDTLWKILMDDFGAKAEDLPYFYEKIREANPEIEDLNRILVGQKILIPEVMHTDRGFMVKPAAPEVYVIKQGQHIAMILREIYGIDDRQIFTEYLDLVKELNPHLDNIDHVIPGQRVRIPEIREVHSALKRQPEVRPDAVPGTWVTEPEQRSVMLSEGSPPEVIPESEEKLVREEEKQAEDLEEQPRVPSEQEPPRESPPRQEAMEAVTPDPGKEMPSGEHISAEGRGSRASEKLIKDSVIPALKDMGGRQKDQGSYFMPMAGGSSITIDTNEIPVIELDTGKRIVFDIQGKISPEIGELMEQAFPSFKVVSGPAENLEALMDQVLHVSGYFSVNRDASPLLIGEEEKVKLFGKWIVYKEYSRRSVFVINLLSGQDDQTPRPIRTYASRFGIDIIELGGRKKQPAPAPGGRLTALKGSYTALFDHLGIPYEQDREIELVASEPVRIVYNAPILSGNVILAETMPEESIVSFLKKRGYRIRKIDVNDLEAVLQDLGMVFTGPPVYLTVAKGRTEIELPALQVGSSIILTRAIDSDIATYLASAGKDVIFW
ncbi:MAG TPA: LysM peptidoglycan-binding domain-containing protein [Deltaproteobacteria bacterium]|nr:LysM peptidoglycan-binding domain-containing protein [Deltaproteobacteria bacterium]